MGTNNWLHYGLAVVFVCLHITLSHYHHYADFSEGIEHKNTCQIYSGEHVPKIKSILSIIFWTIYTAVCFQLTNFPFYPIKS